MIFKFDNTRDSENMASLVDTYCSIGKNVQTIWLKSNEATTTTTTNNASSGSKQSQFPQQNSERKSGNGVENMSVEAIPQKLTNKSENLLISFLTGLLILIFNHRPQKRQFGTYFARGWWRCSNFERSKSKLNRLVHCGFEQIQPHTDWKCGISWEAWQWTVWWCLSRSLQEKCEYYYFFLIVKLIFKMRNPLNRWFDSFKERPIHRSCHQKTPYQWNRQWSRP